MKINRDEIRDIRQLAVSLARELMELGFDLSQKALDTESDTVDVISVLAGALDTLHDDINDVYQERYDELTEQFFKYQPVA